MVASPMQTTTKILMSVFSGFTAEMYRLRLLASPFRYTITLLSIILDQLKNARVLFQLSRQAFT